jgi:organic hydroperoxide reductase OsmC/OhrA
MSDVTYTAVATSTAEGRNGGRATSADGALDVTLAVPKELGGAGDWPESDDPRSRAAASQPG